MIEEEALRRRWDFRELQYTLVWLGSVDASGPRHRSWSN